MLNGERALAIDIVKTQGSNTIEVAHGVRQAVAELQESLPPDVKLDIVRDSSRGIRNSVNNVQQTMIEGGLLTIAIVFLFLHSWRSTVITGLALPISVFGAFMVMAAFGFTLNVLTLMALSLAIGILIDDAIVVRENIMRHIGFGKTHRQAALDGTDEIGLAVLATTFCIVAVFLPVAFMGGIIGRFFFQFGVMVSAAVLISLFVSFTLDPMLSSIWYDPQAHGTGRFARIVNAAQERANGVYRGVLGWSLRWPKTTLLIALGELRRQLRAAEVHRLRVRAPGRPRRAGGVDRDAGRLVAGVHRGQAAPGRRRGARVPRGRLHLRHGQHRLRQRQEPGEPLPPPEAAEGAQALARAARPADPRAAGQHPRHPGVDQHSGRPRRRRAEAAPALAAGPRHRGARHGSPRR